MKNIQDAAKAHYEYNQNFDQPAPFFDPTSTPGFDERLFYGDYSDGGATGYGYDGATGGAAGYGYGAASVQQGYSEAGGGGVVGREQRSSEDCSDNQVNQAPE